MDIMNKFFFVSFASTDIKFALKRIGKQAKRFNFFNKIYLFTEKNLPKYAKKRCKDIIQQSNTKRGYGYWSWKPVIINNVLSKMNDGDILIYSDAGNHLNINGKDKLLNEYIPMAIKDDIWVISLGNELSDICWTKIDTINFFRNNINDKFILLNYEQRLMKGQLSACTIIIKKNNYTVNIMKQWEEFMSLKNLHLFDDSPSIIKENTGFHENRHDQSILSLILKTNHYISTSTEYFWSKDDYLDENGGWQYIKEHEPFMCLRDIHRKNNFSFICKIKCFIKKYLLFRR